MTKRDLIQFIAKLGMLFGVLGVLYFNHFTVTTAGSFSLGALVVIGYVFFKKYKDVKTFCLKEGHRLRSSDQMRIPTALRPIFNWLWTWVIHKLLIVFIFYKFILYAIEKNQDFSDTILQILIIVAISTFLALLSLFVDNNN